ncbi:hypothetical protein [Myxococcus sp. NMCA1]|uniref:hypothetical protein n=1 Tax=Myxococcus sp. NMCA1 TaxID=2996785 RepID=UPI00228579C5|nr:hypothetical protein [Myxococcus sp. NMCA1]WAM23827.1 hypothetical protein OZ403_25130 [Myxococcus sp. NMCA1]
MDGIRMILVGPNEGKDITLGGFTFKGGALVLPPRSSGPAQRLLSRYYSAYPEGSIEGRKAAASYERARMGGADDAHHSRGATQPEYPQVDALWQEQRQAFEEVTSELDRVRAELRTAQAQLRDATVVTPAPTPTPAPVPAPAEEPPAPKGRAKAKAE